MDKPKNGFDVKVRARATTGAIRVLAALVVIAWLSQSGCMPSGDELIAAVVLTVMAAR